METVLFTANNSFPSVAVIWSFIKWKFVVLNASKRTGTSLFSDGLFDIVQWPRERVVVGRVTVHQEVASSSVVEVSLVLESLLTWALLLQSQQLWTLCPISHLLFVQASAGDVLKRRRRWRGSGDPKILLVEIYFPLVVLFVALVDPITSSGDLEFVDFLEMEGAASGGSLPQKRHVFIDHKSSVVLDDIGVYNCE